MLADSDSAPDAVLPSQHPLPCARTAACALSSSESEQSCMYSTHRQALDAGSVSTALPVSKSVKRRRAESVLAAQAMGSPQQRKRQKPDSAQVAACKLAGCSSSGAQNPQWCSMPVELAPCSWASLLAEVGGSEADKASCVAEPSARPSSRPAEGCSSGGRRSIAGEGRPPGSHPGEPSVYVVEDLRQLPAALAHLRASMRDALVAIDLEWWPDFGAGRSRVALLQLASSSAAVLIRTCRLPKGPLPAPLLEFLRDPGVTLVGFGWDGADEGKMRASFGVGRACFGAFLDLQRVAASLGYCDYGLSALAARVLALNLPKPRKVVMSNWEARRLTTRQVAYAALDALVTGQLLRGLRLWHSSPSACPGCRSAIGAPVNAKAALGCGHAGCSRASLTLEGLRQHSRSTDHKFSRGTCADCGRLTLLLPRKKQSKAGKRT